MRSRGQPVTLSYSVCLGQNSGGQAWQQDALWMSPLAGPGWNLPLVARQYHYSFRLCSHTFFMHLRSRNPLWTPHPSPSVLWSAAVPSNRTLWDQSINADRAHRGGLVQFSHQTQKRFCPKSQSQQQWERRSLDSQFILLSSTIASSSLHSETHLLWPVLPSSDRLR